MRKRIYLMRPNVGFEEINAIKGVIQSKFLTEGEITKKFEEAISSYLHSKFAIATTSATTALHTAFHCMRVKGKNVLVSDFTFPATALAVLQAGGKPVLVDVDKETMNVSRAIIEESLADATCFSFHPRKIITTGEGGMITTNDKILSKKFRSFKKFGQRDTKFLDIGTNYKLSDINSAIGLSQLKKIEKIIKKRQWKAKIYNEIFSKIDFIERQKTTSNSRHTYQSYTCIVSKQGFRNKIMKGLSRYNIESQIGTYALHCLPVFKRCPRKGRLNNSEFLYKNSISLPLHEELTNNDQEFIGRIIKNSLN